MKKWLVGRTQKTWLVTISGILLIACAGCSSLDSIPYQPVHTPESWLQIQPFITIRLGSTQFILVQPTSTLFVYLLGLVAIVGGWLIYTRRSGEWSRIWWGVALALWGAGALCAGTSYQAFSYEIKCAGQTVCSWTSWWEIIYLLLSAASVDAMVVAGAFSNLKGNGRRFLIRYAWVHLMVYCGVVITGALLLVPFLISFELLLIAAAPNILLLFFLNVRRYLQNPNPMDRALVGVWVGLGLTIAIYFIYYLLDFTHDLWQRGIWFSENDVLHLGLIAWMMYIVGFVVKQVSDIPE